MAIGETARLLAELGFKDNLTPGVNRALGSVGRLEKGFGRVGTGAGQVATGFARAGVKIALAATAGATAAAKLAIDYESAFAGIRKTVNESELIAVGSSFDELSGTIRKMATEMPIAATELARLGETAGALGVQAGSIDEFIEVTAKLGVTTNLSADQAADAFGRIGTILHLTGKDYEELADSIVALGNAGASTEAEITEIAKRFAAEARAAGLLKEEIVGLASVTASLGFAPERGGTALARVFANLSTNIAVGNDKGKAFAKITGETLKTLRRKVNKGETLPVFMDFLKELRGANPVQAKRMLAAIGVTNTSDRTIFTTMAQNLDEVNRQLKIAETATGALDREAGQRFGTLASKIGTFKNQLIEVGINIGEGMLPAIDRATEKLGELLTDPKFIDQAKKLGRDLGAAIDSVNWKEVLDTARGLAEGLKPALDVALRIADALASLPAEVKGATLALLGLDRLSGGLIGSGLGNMVGGLGEAFAKSMVAKVPLFGSAFVQPVFVTNMVPGGLGGGLSGTAGVAGRGASLGGSLLKGAGALGVGLIVADVIKTSSGQTEQQWQGNVANNFRRLGGGQAPARNMGTVDREGLRANELLAEIARLSTLGKEAERAGREKLAGKFDRQVAKLQDQLRAIDRTNSGIDKVDAKQAQALVAFRAGERTTATGLGNTTRAAQVAGVVGATATAVGSSRVVGAIERKDMTPDVYVTTTVNVTPGSIQRSTTTETSYGRTNGSSGGGRNERRPE